MASKQARRIASSKTDCISENLNQHPLLNLDFDKQECSAAYPGNIPNIKQRTSKVIRPADMVLMDMDLHRENNIRRKEKEEKESIPAMLQGSYWRKHALMKHWQRQPFFSLIPLWMLVM